MTLLERIAASLLVISLAFYVGGSREPKDLPEVDQQEAQAAWVWVLGCTGITPEPGGDFKDIVWQVVPAGSLDVAHHWGTEYIMAMWLPPHTIKVDERYVGVRWVLGHEELHHLMRGPPPSLGGPHPMKPFAFPCKLMPYQNLEPE